MHLIGYREQSRTRVGALLADNSVVPLGDVESFWADPYAAVATVTAATGGPLNVGDLSLAPPVLPSARVLCVGLNYAAHVDEGPFSIPEYPTVFGRWAASLSVCGTPVAVPVDEAGLDWEGELLAVVGRPLKLATAEQAIDGVFAYAAFNDITARRAQKLTTQWTLGKNADNSGPMSALVTADEVGDPAPGSADRHHGQRQDRPGRQDQRHALHRWAAPGVHEPDLPAQSRRPGGNRHPERRRVRPNTTMASTCRGRRRSRHRKGRLSPDTRCLATKAAHGRKRQPDSRRGIVAAQSVLRVTANK